MRKGVLFALATLALATSSQIAAADQHPACGLGCFTTKAADEKQCGTLTGDERRDCLEKASLKYRQCTTTCASSRAKSTPAAGVIKSNASAMDRLLAQ